MPSEYQTAVITCAAVLGIMVLACWGLSCCYFIGFRYRANKAIREEFDGAPIPRRREDEEADLTDEQWELV